MGASFFDFACEMKWTCGVRGLKLCSHKPRVLPTSMHNGLLDRLRLIPLYLLFEGRQQQLPEPSRLVNDRRQRGSSSQHQSGPQKESAAAGSPWLQEGEIIRVLWPAGADISMFGDMYTVFSYHNLQDLAICLGMKFSMRGHSKDFRNRKRLQEEKKEAEMNIVTITGPVGTVRGFYSMVRVLMAGQRRSFKGLLHSRKVTLHALSERGKGAVMEAASALSQLGREPVRQYDEAADSGDEGAPSDECMQQAISRVSGRSVPGVPSTRNTADMPTSSEYPSQGNELGSETMVKGMGALLKRADEYLKVGMRTASRERKRPSACERARICTLIRANQEALTQLRRVHTSLRSCMDDFVHRCTFA